MSFLPILTHRFNITRQNPSREFCKIEQADYKFIKFNKLITKFTWKGTIEIAKHYCGIGESYTPESMELNRA